MQKKVTNRPTSTRTKVTAKFWLKPVRLAWTEGLKVTEVRHALKIAEQQQIKLLEAWNEFFAHES
jgi:hypothetical protein